MFLAFVPVPEAKIASCVMRKTTAVNGITNDILSGDPVDNTMTEGQRDLT